MIGILSNTNSIYFNLASEEYLLKNSKEDVLILWQSDHCVVVGKHQNAMAEINSRFLRQKAIPVARRLSGGGTVYHGPGNINFTFVMNGEKGKMVDFKRFLNPITEFLNEIDVPAEIGPRNEILLNGFKISGSAEHVFKNRVLHHGTLLFNADLHLLEESINSKPDKYIDKAVQSVRSRVTNIQDGYLKEMSIDAFVDELYGFLLKKYNAQDKAFNSNETKKIEELVRSKYEQWEWIYGYSPAFRIERSIRYSGDILKITIRIVKGIIAEVHCTGELEILPGEVFADSLENCRFDIDLVSERLSELQLSSPAIKEIIKEIFF